MPGGAVCEAFQPAPNLFETPVTKPDYVSIHTTRGFIGYVDAKQSHHAVSSNITPNTVPKKEINTAEMAKAPSAESPSKVDEGTKKNYHCVRKCVRCGKVFYKLGAWLHHDCRLAEDSRTSLTCRACGKQAKTRRSIHYHCSASAGENRLMNQYKAVLTFNVPVVYLYSAERTVMILMRAHPFQWPL